MKWTKKNKIMNSRGAVVMSLLIVITVMIVIMTGVASMQVLEIARYSSRMNEAYQTLNVVEEMGQLIARAVMLGWEKDRSGGICPTGTTAYDYDPSGTVHTACLPGTLSSPPTDLCVASKDFKGYASTYCLRTLTLGAAFNVNLITPIATGAGANPSVTTQYESVTPTTIINTNTHTGESWFPEDTAWGFSNASYVMNCSAAALFNVYPIFGCLHSSMEAVATVEFTLCRPKNGAAVTSCPSYYVQRIAVYYPSN